MDPNACLEELLRRISYDEGGGTDERVAELCEALWGWLEGGGFAPKLFENSVVEILVRRVMLDTARLEAERKKSAGYKDERDRYTNRMLLLEGRIEKSTRDLKGRT